MAMGVSPEESAAAEAEAAVATVLEPETPPSNATSADGPTSPTSPLPHSDPRPVQSPLPQRLFESSPQQAAETASVPLAEASTLRLDAPDKQALYGSFISEVSPITAPEDDGHHALQYRCVAPAAITRTFEIGPQRPEVVRHIQPDEIVELVEVKRAGRSLRGRLPDGGWVSLQAGDGTVLLEIFAAKQADVAVAPSKRSSARSRINVRGSSPRPIAGHKTQVVLAAGVSTGGAATNRSPRRPRSTRNVDNSELRRNTTHVAAGMRKEAADRLLGRSNSPNRHGRAQPRVVDILADQQCRPTIFDRRPIDASPRRREVPSHPKPASPTRWRAPQFKETMSQQTKERLMGGGGDRTASARGDVSTSQPSAGYRSTIFAPQPESATFRRPRELTERPSWTANTRSSMSILKDIDDLTPTLWQKHFDQRHEAIARAERISTSDRLYKQHAAMLEKRKQLYEEGKLRRLDEELAEIKQLKVNRPSSARVSAQREPSCVHERLYEEGKSLLMDRSNAEVGRAEEPTEELTFHPKVSKLARRLQAQDGKTPEERLQDLADPSRPRSNSRSRSCSPAPRRNSLNAVNDPRIRPGPAAVLGTSGQSMGGYRCTLFTQAVGEKHLQNQPPRFRQDVRTLVSRAATPPAARGRLPSRVRSESPFNGRNLEADVLHAFSQDELKQFMDAEAAADKHDWDAAIGLYDQGIAEARRNDKTDALKAVLQPYVERVGYLRQQRRSSRQRKPDVAAPEPAAPGEHSADPRNTLHPPQVPESTTPERPSQAALDTAKSEQHTSSVAVLPPDAFDSIPKTPLRSSPPNVQLDLGGSNMTGLQALKVKMKNAEAALTRLRDDVHCATPSPQRGPRSVSTGSTRAGQRGDSEPAAEPAAQPEPGVERASHPSSSEDNTQLMLQRETEAKLLVSDDITLAKHKLRSMSYGSHGKDPRSLLKLYDKDRSGQLSWEEFNGAVRNGGKLSASVPHGLSDDQLRSLFLAVDSDHSGQVSITELTRFVWGNEKLLDKHGGTSTETDSTDAAPPADMLTAPTHGPLASPTDSEQPRSIAFDSVDMDGNIKSNSVGKDEQDQCALDPRDASEQQDGQEPTAVQSEAEQTSVEQSTPKRNRTRRASVEMLLGAAENAEQGELNDALANDAVFGELAGLVADSNTEVEDPFAELAGLVSASTPEQVLAAPKSQMRTQPVLEPDEDHSVKPPENRTVSPGERGDKKSGQPGKAADATTTGTGVNLRASGDQFEQGPTDEKCTSVASTAPQDGTPGDQATLHASAEADIGAQSKSAQKREDPVTVGVPARPEYDVAPTPELQKHEPVTLPVPVPGSMEDLMHQLAQGWGGSRVRAAEQLRNTASETQAEDEKFKAEQRALGLLSSSDDDEEVIVRVEETAPERRVQPDAEAAQTDRDQVAIPEPPTVAKTEQKILSETDTEVEVEFGGDEFLCDKASQAVFALADSEAEEVGRWDGTARRIIFFAGLDVASSAAAATDTDEASEDDGVASDTDEGTDDDKGPPPLGKMGTRASLAPAMAMKPRRGPPEQTQKSTPPPQSNARAAASTTTTEESFGSITGADPFAEIEAMASGGGTGTSNSSQMSSGDDPFAELADLTSLLPNRPGAGSDNDPFAELQALVS